MGSEVDCGSSITGLAVCAAQLALDLEDGIPGSGRSWDMLHKLLEAIIGLSKVKDQAIHKNDIL